MSAGNNPDPMVPAEVDLRSYGYIPLQFRRLFASDTWVLGSPEERVAALHLWCESWHQSPAASLPNDERILAHLSGAGQRWIKIRDHALRGWKLCSDNRLYHPVIADMAMEAWGQKREKSRKGKLGASKRWGSGNGPDMFEHGTRIASEVKGREVKGRELQPAASAFELPAWIDAEAWAGFVDMRAREKHPLTERAKKLIVADLEALRSQGQDPNACLDQSSKRGWRGVFSVKGDVQPRPGGDLSSRTADAVKEFVRRGGAK